MSRATPSESSFYAVSALLFAAATIVIALWCASMSSMPEMAMPGGWTMSMTWMRMPGQTWTAAALSFVAMWTTMMVAMMLPSLLPMLSRYRRVVGPSGSLTAIVGAGYFLVWTLLGLVLFPVGVAVAALEMQVPALARAVPVAVGVIALIAGALQFTAWKARHLECCRNSSICARPLQRDAGVAWRHGVRLGVHCTHCCAGLTAILLVAGVMDLWAMAAVTVAITLERLAPQGRRVARIIGILLLGLGSFLIARAAEIG